MIKNKKNDEEEYYIGDHEKLLRKYENWVPMELYQKLNYINIITITKKNLQADGAKQVKCYLFLQKLVCK